MKTMYKTMSRFLVIIILSIITTLSCEEYLDKAPQVNITQDDVFSKFNNFQGFMENAYQCIVDLSFGMKGVTNYNFGDDIVLGSQTIFISPEFERGNYWFWEDINASPFYGNIASVGASTDKGYWQSGWYGIRLANLALENLNKLPEDATEEKNLISGQAYFFRGFFHFEIIKCWGGVPYITKSFSPSEVLRYPRLSYKQCADSITADLTKAAQRLPVSWDLTTVGQVTAGFNKGRVTKAAAYGYLGKNLLFLASPLMNGITTGSYTYNEDICKQAAVALFEVIRIHRDYPQYLNMETWANYSKSFYTLTSESPSGPEVIFSNPVQTSKVNGNSQGEQVISNFGGFGTYAGPTENYIENFGMANGLPITAPGSGYDPNNPWVGRDPRFYYSVLLDGERIIKNTENSDTYFQSYVGGRHRTGENTRTGYGTKKYKDITCNSYDRGWSANYWWEVPHMRLPDIYLMYAEAVNEAYGPNTVPPNIPGGLTAIQAINIIRQRVEVSPGVSLPNVDAQFDTEDEVREIIRQERAVELCFEAHRWYDLRRWYVAHLPKFREKYTLEFDAAHSYYRKALWGTIVFEDKHYWLPFNIEQATLYKDFPQNPGW